MHGLRLLFCLVGTIEVGTHQAYLLELGVFPLFKTRVVVKVKT